MIVGLGLDVCSTARVAAALDRFGDRFWERILSPKEREDLAQRADRATALAGRFAAKEAAKKALAGAPGVGWHQLRVRGGGREAPELELVGRARRLADERGVVRAHLSITHDAGVAAAVVILERRSSQP
jgi:holo-[acyl-carrier protein] synthase